MNRVLGVAVVAGTVTAALGLAEEAPPRLVGKGGKYAVTLVGGVVVAPRAVPLRKLESGTLMDILATGIPPVFYRVAFGL